LRRLGELSKTKQNHDTTFWLSAPLDIHFGRTNTRTLLLAEVITKPPNHGIEIPGKREVKNLNPYPYRLFSKKKPPYSLA